MDKELKVSVDKEGLTIDGADELTPEQLGVIIDELSITYCENPSCLNSMKPYLERDCEECRIFGTAHEIRKRLQK